MTPAKKKATAKRSTAAKKPAAKRKNPASSRRAEQPLAESTPTPEPTPSQPAVAPSAETEVQPVPGVPAGMRSLTLIGAGVTLAAMLWGWKGLVSGIWSVLQTLLLLGLIGLVAARYLPPGKPLADKFPPLLRQPVVPVLLTLLVAARAVQMAGFSVGGILWVAAAALLVFDRYRETKARFAESFGLSHAMKGMATLVTAGVAICLVSLFFNWSRTAGYLYPGYGYSVYSGTFEYGFSTYYAPGLAFAGRGFGSSFIVILVLLGLLALAMFAKPPALPSWGPSWGKFIAPAAVALIFVWWFWAKFIADSDEGLGPWLFLVGLGLTGFAVVKSFLAKPSAPTQ